MNEQPEPDLATAAERRRRRTPSNEAGQPTEETTNDAGRHRPTIYRDVNKPDGAIGWVEGLGTSENRDRVILHFAEPWTDVLGRARWKYVIVITPGDRCWICETVEVTTRRHINWEAYSAITDPYDHLCATKQPDEVILFPR